MALVDKLPILSELYRFGTVEDAMDRVIKCLKAMEALRTMQDLCHSIKVLEGLEEVHPSGLRAFHFLGGNFCPNWKPVDLEPLGLR